MVLKQPKHLLALCGGAAICLVLIFTFQPVPVDAVENYTDAEATYTMQKAVYQSTAFINAVEQDAANDSDVTSNIKGGNPAGPIDVKFSDSSTLNNLDFARFCKWIGASRCGYVYGAQGELCTKALCDSSTARFGSIAEGTVSYKWIGRLSFDCSGVLRGYSRFNSITKSFGTYKHTYSGVDDIWEQSKNLKHGLMGTMPDVPGIAVVPSDHSHIGYYIGNKQIMDAHDSATGCQVRAVANAPEFKEWFYINGITYK